VRPEILKGNAIERLRGEPEARYRLILTDPPYGILRDQFGDAPNWAEYGPEFERVLKPGGQLVVFGTFRSLSDAYQALCPWFELRRDIIWVKGKDSGHLQPGQKPSQWLPAPAHETILWLGRRKDAVSQRIFNAHHVRRPAQAWPSSQPAGRKLSGNWGGGYARTSYTPKRISKSPSRAPIDVWFARVVKDGPLSCSKPPELLRDLILMLSDPGDSVLDPFAGGGSTLLAAYRTARRSVGYELDQTRIERLARLVAGYLEWPKPDQIAEVTPVVPPALAEEPS
jgi:hypothetical protein